MKNRWNTYKSFVQKRGNFLFLSLLILFSLLYQLLWLALGILALALFYFVLIKAIQKLIQNTKIQLFIRRIVQLVIILIVCICGRLFVIDVYKIPSESMENTLFAEDIIVVNKLSYGPLLPKSMAEIPWIGLFFSGSFNTTEPNKRLPGTGEIQHGDVIVFQRSNGKFAVKRCIGIAGDEFQIEDGIISINGQTYEETLETKKAYEVHVSDLKTFYQEVKTLPSEVKAYPVPKKSAYFELHLTSELLSKVHQFTSVDTINILNEDSKEEHIANINYFADWDANNVEPVFIPKKGMQIRWNLSNFQQYKETLKAYEHVIVTQKDDQFYVNGKLSTTYTFQNDYLFLMGDNRKNSQDSRNYGFVPQEQVIGKVSRIVYSNHKGSFQWNRLLKKAPENPQRK